MGLNSERRDHMAFGPIRVRGGCGCLGNIWVTGPGGVWVVSPDGEKLGVIETPEVCGSLCWGAGDEAHTLFLMTTTTAHIVETLVGPAPLPPF